MANSARRACHRFNTVSSRRRGPPYPLADLLYPERPAPTPPPQAQPVPEGLRRWGLGGVGR